MIRRNPTLTLLLALGALGCGDDAGLASGGGGGDVPGAAPAPTTTTAGPGATGVGQIGAQDFGLFRQILDDGMIPAPGTLDAVGFFAEHKLDYPLPECGDDLCVHALLGVQGNMVDGGDCTVIQIGMNSPLRPDAADRPPLDLVLALDVSGSMRGGPIEALRAGLHRMLDHLGPDDTVTIVPYATEAYVALPATGLEGRAELEAAIDALATRGNTNIYDGLFLAFEQAEQRRAPDREARVVLLSDGVATTGLVDPARLRRLAEAYARRGIGVTTIGVGVDFDVDVMRGISEVGAGNFYFLENPAAVEEVFADEVQTFLVPVALDATLELRVGPHYVVRGAYGTHAWRGGRHGGKAELPALFLAGRQRADDPVAETGRRGGGGGVLIELGVVPGATAPAGEPVGVVELRFTDPRTGERRRQTTEVVNPMAPGEMPVAGWFTDDTVAKGFVMLNLYVGFELAMELTRDGDLLTALATLQALRAAVGDWLLDHPDPDITDDLAYVDRFVDLLEARRGEATFARPPDGSAARPRNPWPAD